MKKYLLMLVTLLQMQPMVYAATYSGPVEDMKRAYDKANDPISINDFPTARELRAGLKQPIYSLNSFGFLRTTTASQLLMEATMSLTRIEFTISGIPSKGPFFPGIPDRKSVLLGCCKAPLQGQRGSDSCDILDGKFNTESGYWAQDTIKNDYLVIKPTEIQTIDKLSNWRQIVRKSGKLFLIRNYNTKSDDRSQDRYSYGWVN